MPATKRKAQSVKPRLPDGQGKTTTQSSKIGKIIKNLTIDVFDTKGKVVKKMQLSKEIFGAEVNKKLLAQASRVYLANQRKASASTKTRGEVSGSTRKIYRQKGTGRARHGGIRAPIFVHGGVAHGPKPHDYSLTLPKKMKKQALFCALSASYKQNGIKVVDGLQKITPKTKVMVKILKNLSLDPNNKQDILFVVTKEFGDAQKAARNIAGVDILQARQLNTYEVLRHDVLVFPQEAVSEFTNHFLREEKN